MIGRRRLADVVTSLKPLLIWFIIMHNITIRFRSNEYSSEAVDWLICAQHKLIEYLGMKILFKSHTKWETNLRYKIHILSLWL